jgi:hypothetical protein
MAIKNNKSLLTTYIIIYLISLVATYFIDQGITLKVEPVPLLKAVSSAFGPMFVGVWVINKYAWRWYWFRKILGIKLPYIHGRWKGYIRSSFTQHSVRNPIVIEIWQELDEIRLWYFDKNAVTKSLIAGFALEHEAAPPRLYCVYYNEPIRTDQKKLQPHNGVMEFFITSKDKQMKGVYYNNPHQRPTYGEIHLEFVNRKLLGGFEDAAK